MKEEGGRQVHPSPKPAPSGRGQGEGSSKMPGGWQAILAAIFCMQEPGHTIGLMF